MEQQRLTAVKTRILPLGKGTYVEQEGFIPNYVITSQGVKLSRARILGTVVRKFVSDKGTFASLTLDDGTDTIRINTFQDINLFDDIQEGDIVDVIGKVRSYQEEINIIAECVKKITDPNWEILRELELKKQDKMLKQKRNVIEQYKSRAGTEEELKQLLEEEHDMPREEADALLRAKPEEEKHVEHLHKRMVLKLIEEHEAGSGCSYGVLVEKSGLDENALDAIINELLEEGICFEPTPGKLKKL